MHGLGGRKEGLLPTLYAFARHGMRAAALDARRHGERPGAEEREDRLAQDYLGTMYEMISGTAKDIGALLDHLGDERAAIHGISLGGYIAFAAMLDEPRLAVAAVAMGSPDWLGPLRESGIDLEGPIAAALKQINPLDRAEFTYPPRPLLMLHGTDDDVVSAAGVQALYERLRPSYAAAPERLELALFPGLGHEYTTEMLERSIAWTKRYL
jgi:hypothetical protein